MSLAKSRSILFLLLIFPFTVMADDYDDGLNALLQKDYAQARLFFQRAAENSDSGAAFELWHLYHDGLGGERDDQQGLQWLLVAAYLGLGPARFELAEFYAAHKDIAHAEAHAIYWWQAAAGDKQPLAYFRLGQAYEAGAGVKVDYKQAQAYYRQANNYLQVHAEKGNAEAQFYLATSYEQGHGVNQNWEQALAWYKKAGSNGYTPGLTHVGRLLLLQAKNDAQLQQAAYWLTLAKDRGSELAAVLLKEMPSSGGKKALVSR